MLALTFANVIALISIAVSYFWYSKLLIPSDFAVYAGGLAIAKIGTTLLDGGLKVALVKHFEEVNSAVKRALFLLSCGTAVLAFGVLSGVLFALVAHSIVSRADAFFYCAYASAYFFTYPFLFIPLADLERRQQFVPVAMGEGVSMVIEYALPAILWLSVAPGFWSFILAAWLARVLRTSFILYPSSDRTWFLGGVPPQWKGIKPLFQEGSGIQLGVAVSMLRDSLHLLLVGPMFGKEWVGLYAWALQLCGVASQVFVQTAARVSLPALRLAPDMHSRWHAMLGQVIWMAILTGPILVFLTPLATSLNHYMFADKWATALELLPFLVIRMLPGLATTPLSSLVLAERGAKSYFVANLIWTVFEVALATLLLLLIGPMGLAWCYAIGAWVGVLAFLTQLPRPAAFLPLLPPLFLRSSIFVAISLLLVFSWFTSPAEAPLSIWYLMPAAGGAALVCYMVEPKCRERLSFAARARIGDHRL